VGEDGEGGSIQAASRARIGIGAAAVILLAGLIAIILVSSRGSEQGAGPPAPHRCLEAWNSDPRAIEFGRHNSLSHGYSDVQVGYMPAEGSRVLTSAPDGGRCAVVFAASQLDPEPIAAGEIHVDGEWTPLSSLLESADLAELQSTAVGEANAHVTPAGDLSTQAP
jgi:hypothetical protein